MHGLPLVTTGDAAFDREFLVKSDDPDGARAMIDGALRERLQRSPRRPLALTCDRGDLELMWEPEGFDGDHVDAAVALLELLCARRRATSPRVAAADLCRRHARRERCGRTVSGRRRGVVACALDPRCACELNSWARSTKRTSISGMT